MSKFKLMVAALVGAVFAGGASSRGAMLSVCSLYANVDTVSNSASVTSLPYVTPVTASDANATSIATPDFTSTTLKTTFSQTATAFAEPISGETLLNFVANAGDTYSVFGSSAAVGGTSSLDIQLYDSTSQQYVYHNSDGNILFGTSTGNLTGGDLYNFILHDYLNLNQVLTNAISTNSIANLGSNTGSGGITILQGISVPEPATTGILMTTAGMAMFARKRRRV